MNDLEAFSHWSATLMAKSKYSPTKDPAMASVGSRKNRYAADPSVKQTVNSKRPTVLTNWRFPRTPGSSRSWLSRDTVFPSFWLVRHEILQTVDDLFHAETVAAGPGYKLPHQLGQPALTFDLILLDLFVSDERPRALMSSDDPSNLQLSIGADHSIRVDREIHSELANSGQLIAINSFTCQEKSSVSDGLPADS